MADGVGAQREPERQSRGSVGRPHWWVVLAVTLSLMAMIAAVRASRGGHVAAGRAADHVRTDRRPATTPPTTVPAVRSTTTSSTVDGGTTTTTETDDLPGGPPATTTTQPAVAGLVSDPGAAAAPASGVTSTTLPPDGQTTDLQYPGNLQYPDNVAVTLGFATSPGDVTVTASWSTSVELQLLVHCDGGATPTEEGASGLSIDEQSTGGDCSVTLSEPTNVQASLSYEIDVVYEYPAT